MATSAYLSPGPPPLSDQEEGGVMNLVNPAVSSQSYSVPREQVVSSISFITFFFFTSVWLRANFLAPQLPAGCNLVWEIC